MKKLVLISGISGAGKSTASNIMEDMGFTCIDQYPAELLPDLIELIKNDDSIRYEKVALTIGLSDLDRFSNLLSNSDFDSNGMCSDNFNRPNEVSTSICHTMKAYQNYEYIGIRQR